jgi:hypothetical protein
MLGAAARPQGLALSVGTSPTSRTCLDSVAPQPLGTRIRELVVICHAAIRALGEVTRAKPAPRDVSKR